MKQISAETFQKIVESKKDDPTVDFINVCTPAEYKEKNIPGVRSLPLDELDARFTELQDKKTVYVHCRSGKRGARAIEKLQNLGLTAELVNVEGGLLAWDEAGLPTDSLTNRLPLMRQVMLAAGSLILLGYLLSLFVHEQLILLSVFVGLGLLTAGLTGWCGMSRLLELMPWNR